MRLTNVSAACASVEGGSSPPSPRPSPGGRGGQNLRARGFTLIELLVSVSIIGVLVAITLPTLGMARLEAQRALCLSNLHQLALASNQYLDDYRDQYWRYYWAVQGGRQWWFGFESNGPGSGANRPLDLERNVLSRYLQPLDDRLQCPSFPYNDAKYFHKFSRRSASYGYNIRLGPANAAMPVHRRSRYAGHEAGVFVFADGIHFDTNPGFNEGHYIIHTPNPLMKSGYAHFRHKGVAQVLMMDGHAEGQQLYGKAHSNLGGGAAGNLVDAQGGNTIYGF